MSVFLEKSEPEKSRFDPLRRTFPNDANIRFAHKNHSRRNARLRVPLDLF